MINRDLPQSLHGHAAGKVLVVTATGEAGVAPDTPAFGDFCFAADGQYKVGSVLYVAHIVGVGRIAHVAVAQLRFRPSKSMLHTCTDPFTTFTCKKLSQTILLSNLIIYLFFSLNMLVFIKPEMHYL